MPRNCPSCGRANDDDARFCSACAAELVATCPSCGTTLPADAVFCRACGAVVVAAPAAAATSAAPPPPVAPSAPAPPTVPPVSAAPPQSYAAAPARFEAGGGGGVPPAPPPDMGRGAGGPPRRGPGAALLVALIVLAAAAAAAAAVYFFILRDDPDNGGGKKSPTPVASSSSAAPSPSAGGYLAAAVGHQGNVLGTVDPDGAVKELASSLGSQIFQIAYSPDGKRIAFIAGEWDRPELSIADVEDGSVQQVAISSPAIVGFESIAWLGPEALLVAGFTVKPNFQGEDAELLVYDPVAGTSEPLKDGDGVALRGISVSASVGGEKIAYVMYTDQKADQYGFWTATESLMLLDRDSGTVTRLGSGEAAFDVNARRFDDPQISPTGTAIIYRQAGSDVGTAYTVIDANGTTLMPAKQLLYPAGYAWDPSGTKVVFTGQPPNATGNASVRFFLFDLNVGGEPQRIAKYADTMVQDLAWSPDGGTIAWAEWDPVKYRGGHLYLMAASGGDSRTLARWAMSPAWAPGAEVPPSSAPSPSPSTSP